MTGLTVFDILEIVLMLFMVGLSVGAGIDWREKCTIHGPGSKEEKKARWDALWIMLFFAALIVWSQIPP